MRKKKSLRERNNIATKKYREANKEKARKYSKRSDVKTRHSFANKKYRVKNKKKITTYNSRPDRKIKQAAATRRWMAKRFDYTECVVYPSPPMDSRCDICSRVEKLNLDHDHITGKFRGYLCLNCNLGLGKFGDNLDNLKRVVVYLERGNA